MELKKLKIYGFKSFANKTVISFEDPFIGIVGPNGSGKSNIIDAIRWVFGEQSNKSLRGESSTDVIFGGTQTKRKQNFAEVTIVFDNSDNYLEIEFLEVEVTRRLYRNGISEYLINGVESRLKDINDLFLDKGIGKNSFSIISQGKIEEILSTNQDHRRQIIEETAGILKYKKRKESTVNKLKKTSENIHSVDLIIEELNNTLIPLEKQAKDAIKFERIDKLLKQKEISFLANSIQNGSDEYKYLKKEQEDLNLKIIDNQKVINSNLENENICLNNQNKLLNKIEIISLEIIEKQEKLTDLKINLKVLYERESNNNDHDREYYLKNKVLENNNQLDKNIKEYNELKIKYDYLVSKIDLKKTDYLNDQDIVYKSKEKINDLEFEINQLSLPYATRKIIDENIKGVINTVSNLFTTDNKFMQAISIAIGGKLNNIIVENKYTAQVAIDHLKKYKLGRQTFLPIDSMKSYYIDQSILNKLKDLDGFYGSGIDLIEYDDMHSKVFENLLGNIIIVKDLKIGNEIVKNITRKYPIITIDGDFLATSGSLSGGFHKKKNKLILKSELEKFQSLLKDQENKFNKSQNEYKLLLNEINDLSHQLENISKKIETDESENNILKIELSKFNNEYEHSNTIEEELDQLSKEIKVLEKDQLEYKYEAEKNKEQLDNIRLKTNEFNYENKLNNHQLKDNEIKLIKIESDLSNNQLILSEEYSLGFELALEKSDKDIDLDKYKKDINDLKRKIRNLGPVNFLAVQEYKSANDRYQFIKEQLDDLLISKNKLEDVINRLDQYFKESFKAAYIQLRSEFQIIFKELFGGGEADLILTNPEDMLTTGVEIIAQPPGKKLQTISLLSGGEKTLTAISLIFSIIRMKKVPFVILDEVDAALDESNVKRYAEYIKLFSSKTQFIVITHRPTTMECIDSLYGVTMEEEGISSLVKVNLKEGENYV